jgi:hypothetical protein
VVGVPRRKGGGRRVDPEVERLFDTTWQALAGALEGEAVYDVEAPFTAEKVLEEVEERMRQELEDVLHEKLTFVLCDACYCVPQHFLNYIFYGELPTRGDLEGCISEYLTVIGESSGSLDEYVKEVNELYKCLLLLDKLFDALPDLLEVKAVEGDVAPSLCSEDFTPEDIARDAVWYVGFSTGIARDDYYYGVRDGRVVVLRHNKALGARTCEEGFEEEMLPRLTSGLKELEDRLDAVVHVYGDPPVNPKSVVPGVTVRRLTAPPRP